MPSHNHYISNYTGSSTSWLQDNPVGSHVPSNPSSINTNPTGGGEAYNNLQPYITCYMFKRTA
jgi:hypothetical protein